MASCLATAQLCSPPLAPRKISQKTDESHFSRQPLVLLEGVVKEFCFKMIPTFQHFFFSLFCFALAHFSDSSYFITKWTLVSGFSSSPQTTQQRFSEISSQIFELLGESEGLDEIPPFKSNPVFFYGCPWWVLNSFVLAKNTNCVMHPLGWRMIFPGARHGCVQCLWRNWIM